jgi:hypothetical protein
MDASLHHKRIPIAIITFIFILPSLLVFASRIYTSSVLAQAHSRGVYLSAEQAMMALINQSYRDLSRIDILFAGPNSFDRSQAHVWYVTAEVRAGSRAGGFPMGDNGCDAPGSYFLQTREGWVHVPEGAFPDFIGFWMGVFGEAGPGQSNPSTDWAPTQPARFCQST